ncbi:MAG TPA: hypothetical protein PK771_01220 [Spirochaetota bacterium]|nr:hypothetical protein [Spirochaetota bacterium]
MESLFFFGIFIIIFVVIASVNFFKFRKMVKQKNNAQIIFSRENGQGINIINSLENPTVLTNYLNSLLQNKAEENIVVEVNEIKPNSLIKNNLTFLKFDNNNSKIDILSNPDKLNQSPLTVSYSDVEKILLGFRSFSETRGSGKSSRTYYYNQYWVTIKFKNGTNTNDVSAYNKITYVSQDKGLFETESRSVGELLAKIFKVNLVRIDGTEIEYTKLDESVTEKLKDFVRSNYSFKKEPFITQDIENGYCISELQYYNIPKMVLGIIFISILDIVSIFLLFRFHFLGRETNVFYVIGLIFLIELVCGLLIFYWVNASKNKTPTLKPIINIFRDKLVTNLKFKNGQLISSDEAIISKIEEIVVRYETSLGNSVKLIADEFSIRVASYSDVNKSNYLRDEILDIIKRVS